MILQNSSCTVHKSYISIDKESINNCGDLAANDDHGSLEDEWMVMKNLRKVGTVLRRWRSPRHDCLQSPRRELLILGSPLDVGCSWPAVQRGVLVLLVLEGRVGLDTGGDTRVAANYLLCLKKILFVVGKCFFVTLLKVLTRFLWHLRN